jgi:hypothetical protein
MASYKLAEILKSRSDLSEAEIERMEEDEAWQWIRANPAAASEPKSESAGEN